MGERWSYLNYARLLEARDDLEGYRKYLGRLLESDGKRLDAGSILELGRIVGLEPCPVEDAKRVVHLIRSYPHDPASHPGDHLALAMALYRAGECDPARDAIQQYMTQDQEGAWYAHPLMAMVEQGLGHRREAEEQVEKARRKRDEIREHAASRRHIFDPATFEYDLLLRQAESALGAKGGPS